MAKSVQKLSALKVKKLKEPGWYPDGLGLYLQVSPSGSKSWVYRFKLNGRERRQGLGRYPDTSLDTARTKALESRTLRDRGIDPIERHKEIREAEKKAEKIVLTFRDCAEQFIAIKSAEWRNAKHETQWYNTLRDYAYPEIGLMAVDDVALTQVLNILNPIWTTKTETATRVRQRVEAILDWATVSGHRTGENPARWRGHLEAVLPKPSKVRKVKHHAALHYSEIPEFMVWLNGRNSLSSLAVRFIILTACRVGEGRKATEQEVDSEGIWNIPELRMKSGRPHRVPLSAEALGVLEQAGQFAPDARYFPGEGRSEFISETALLKLVKQYRNDLTVHGFRSTFRDWCAECTNYPREIAEAALAHQLKSETERAYQRGDLLKKRANLMKSWADYCKSGQTAMISPRVLKINN